MLGGYYLGQLYLGESGLPAAGILSVVPSSHQLSSENVTLTQKHAIVVSDTSHSHTVESVVLTQKHVLSVDGAIHSLMSENAAITSEHFLGVNDSFHGVTSPEAVLTQKHTIVVENALHALASGNLDLVEHKTLVVQNTTHGHTAENTPISVKFYLVVQNAQHGHMSANLGLTQKQVIVVANTTHGLTSTTIEGLLSILPNGYGGGYGAIEAWGLKQFGEINIEFPLHYYILAGNSYHQTLSTNTTLTQKHNLVVDNATHWLTSDVLDLVETIYRYGGVYIRDEVDNGTLDNEYEKSTGTMPSENGSFGQITPVTDENLGFLVVDMGTSGSYTEDNVNNGILDNKNRGSGSLTTEVIDTGIYTKDNNNTGDYEVQ